MAQGLKPSDNPEIVCEFETRLLLVVFPVLCIYFFLHGSWCPFVFFFYLGVGAAVLCCHFSVHLIFLTINIKYTPMEVVPPVVQQCTRLLVMDM